MPDACSLAACRRHTYFHGKCSGDAPPRFEASFSIFFFTATGTFRRAFRAACLPSSRRLSICRRPMRAKFADGAPGHLPVAAFRATTRWLHAAGPFRDAGHRAQQGKARRDMLRQSDILMAFHASMPTCATQVRRHAQAAQPRKSQASSLEVMVSPRRRGL